MTDSIKNAQVNHGLSDFHLTENDLEIVENEHGANRREQLQANYREAVEVAWSYIYRKDTELSRPAED